VALRSKPIEHLLPDEGTAALDPSIDPHSCLEAQRNRLHDSWRAAAGFESTLAHPDGDPDTGQDAQRVGADGKGPQVPHGLWGAWNEHGDDQGRRCPFAGQDCGQGVSIVADASSMTVTSVVPRAAIVMAAATPSPTFTRSVPTALF